MFFLKHLLLAVATTMNPAGLYRTQCNALLTGNLRAYAATLAPSYRFVDLGGKVENRSQILATYTRWFQEKSGRIESCSVGSPTAPVTASTHSLPIHLVEDVAIAIPSEVTRTYRIDLHGVERWKLIGGRWRAVESRVVSRSVTPI